MNVQTVSMVGKTALVTGATSGIGLETARALARSGALVIVTGRDASRGSAVVAEFSRRGGRAESLLMDMASFDSVRKAAEHLMANHRALDVLVNNAGIAVKHHELTADGYERTWETNFLSHFLLTRLVLPALKRAPHPRVVNVSSAAHATAQMRWDNLGLEGEFRGFKAYAQSKLAQVLFTAELARREPEIVVTAVHPGTIATRIWRALPAPMRWILMATLPGAEKGARPVVRLASTPELGEVSGRYFDRMVQRGPAPQGKSVEDAARLWELAERATS